MSGQWRLFLAALRFVTFRPDSSFTPSRALPHEATRFIPLAGICVGLLSAATYWVASQLWPTSVAVVLAMLATGVATLSAATTADPRPGNLAAFYWVFTVLIKYNALMALSAASMPFSIPMDLTLGLIMVAGHAASYALLVSVMAGDDSAAARVSAADRTRVTNNDLTVALILGLTPAIPLGIPGLVGLVAAILTRLVLTRFCLPADMTGLRVRLDVTRQVTEASFYLGALATWRFI